MIFLDISTNYFKTKYPHCWLYVGLQITCINDNVQLCTIKRTFHFCTSSYFYAMCSRTHGYITPSQNVKLQSIIEYTLMQSLVT